MLYFAYASFLSSDVLREHCPSARFVSRTYLPNFEVDFTYMSKTRNCGVASVEPAPGKIARGVVYDVPDDEMEHLDVVEAVPQGHYYRETYVLVDENGEFIRADTYRATEPKGPFTPNREYVGLMLKGAKEHDLDPDYIESLETLLSQLKE